MNQQIVATIVAGCGSALSQEQLSKFTTSSNAMSTAWLVPGVAADIFCEGTPAQIQTALKKAVGEQPYDVFAQLAATRRKKFLIADMESTIIEQEMLDELAETIGLRDKVAQITRRAMNGELDFAEALMERVALLKGQPSSVLNDVAKRITYNKGARELVAAMKSHGAQCWLVSGGFTCFVEPVAKTLGFDRFYANDLIIEGGKITGAVAKPILDKNSKKNFLEQACRELNIHLSETVAVGDGANDIPMLLACHEAGGLGVAYEAKPNVRAVIPQQINYSDLTALLYAQGFSSPLAGEEAKT